MSATTTGAAAGGPVYSLGGQRRGSSGQLPGGIYISNGRKYVKRH